jgi:hypothetical protein
MKILDTGPGKLKWWTHLLPELLNRLILVFQTWNGY